MMAIAHKPDEQRIETTVEQLRHLLECLIANDVETAKMWLMAAIQQAKRDLRDGN